MKTATVRDRPSATRGESLTGGATLVLSGVRVMQVGVMRLMAFHLGLMLFGWRLWLYAVPMLGELTLLLRGATHGASGEDRE